MAASRQHSLSGLFRFTLFATSYTPLFGLIAFKQLNDNPDFLHWGGLSLVGLKTWVTNYLLSTILLILIALSLLGLIYFLRLLRQRTVDNGNPIRLVAVRNRNSEAIGYIGSYIIPFLFQSYKTLYENAATVLLLGLVYQIYIHSTLLLINPLLTLRYSLYEVDFKDASAVPKTGMLIINNRYLEADDLIRIYPVGPRLYFGLV